MLEIIIFLIIAIFLFFKLKSILGEEYDNEMFGYNNIKEKVKQKIKTAEPVNINDEFKKEKYKNLSDKAKNIADELSKQINGFSLEKFEHIASKVFEEIIKANEEQNKDTIKNFFSPELANSIISSFEEDVKNHIILVAFDECKIDNIEKGNGLFTIQVIFNTQQINYTSKIEDNNEAIVDGSKTEIISVKERWSFVRKIRQQDNTWFVDKIDEI